MLITGSVGPHFFYYPCKILLEKGYDVEYLTLNYGKAMVDELAFDGIKIPTLTLKD